MPRVLRAYIPTCKSVFNHTNQVPLQSPGLVTGMSLSVPVSLPHRRVWAWGWSVSATWSMQLSFQGLLQGRVVYEQLIINWTTAAVFDKWYSGIDQVVSQIGASNEQIFTQIGGGATFAVSPWRLNLTCDTIALNLLSQTGVAALFDFGLHVTSQQGV